MKSFGTAKKFDYHLSLLSYDRWGDKRETEFAYYKDLFIENQKNVSGEFIKTATELHETISVMVTTCNLQAYMMR